MASRIRGSFSISIASFIAVILVYAGLAALGMTWTRGSGEFAAMWLANGFLVASILLRRDTAAAAYIVACFAVSLSTSVAVGDPGGKALAIGVCNAIEVGIVYALVKRVCGLRPDLANIRTLGWFLLLGGIAGPFLSACLAALLFFQFGLGAPVEIWSEWFFSRSLGMLVIAPVSLIITSQFRDPRTWPRQTIIEYLVIFAAGSALSAAVFLQTSYPFLFMTSIFALVAAFRLGMAGTSLSVVVIAMIAIVATIGESGPVYLVRGDVRAKIFVLQIFLLFTFAGALPVATVLENRTRLRRELRESRDFAQSILDNMREIVFRTDERGCWTFLNPAWEKITGYPVADALGWPTTKLLTPASFDETRALYPPLIAGEVDELVLNQVFIRADREHRYIEVSVRAIRDEDGNFAGTTGNIRDVTERRAAQHALRESESRFRRIAQSAPVGFFQADADGNMTFISETWCKRLGKTEEEMLGDGWLSAVRDSTPFEEDPAWVGFDSPTDRKERQTCFVGANGEDIWVHTVNQPEFDQQGRLTGFVGVIVDITEQRRSVQALREARDAAEAAARAKTAFLANMSHEIRTPMNGVIGFTELLEQSGLTEHQSQYVELIAESGRTMMALLNDILDFSKIDAGLMSLISEPFDLPHMVQGTRRMMMAAAIRKDLRLDLDIADDVPRMVRGDKLRMRQILSNLIGNAVKFTRAGSVTVTVRRCPASPKNIEIAVIDTGIGIPRDRQAAIFEEFVQADSKTARSHGGTGLGLAISRRLARMMGGDISLESEEGRGTTFTLSVPFEAVDTARDMDEDMTGLDGGLSSAEERQVLLVEDHEINRLLAEAMLQRLGCRVELAENGQQALDILFADDEAWERFDLVLMDIQMPGLDGLETTRRLRAQGIDANRLPVVALTANAYAEDIAACEAAGMQAHIAKPLRFEELREAIAKWTPDAHQTAAPAAEDPAIALLRPKYEAFRTRVYHALIDALKSDPREWNEDYRAELISVAHKLSGSAETFGDAEIGRAAKQFEEVLEDAASPIAAEECGELLLLLLHQSMRPARRSA